MNVQLINMDVTCMLYALILLARMIVPVNMDLRAMVVTAKVLYKAIISIHILLRLNYQIISVYK